MVKELDDYLDILENKYPHIPRKELKKVLEYGFHKFYLLNKVGGDIQIRNNKFTAYCGKMFLDNLKRYVYNYRKSKIKLHLCYNYAQEVYNGIYYFGLDDDEWTVYQSQLKRNKRNKIKFTNLRLYKIKEECFLEKSKTHFFTLDYPIDVGWTFTKNEVKTRNFKYFAFRDDQGKIVIINHHGDKTDTD